ncbi:MAG: SRPBCC family protein [Bdellovibrionales bacterium]
MADAKTVDLYNCTPEEFYKIITDYEKYSEFLSEVKDCKILKVEGNRKLVEFTVNVLKDFKYRLWMSEDDSRKDVKKISWVLESGDMFKVSNGYWELAEEADKTRATYYVDAKFNMFVPGPIAKALVNVNLPNMVSSYRKRIKDLYGK